MFFTITGSNVKRSSKTKIAGVILPPSSSSDHYHDRDNHHRHDHADHDDHL